MKLKSYHTATVEAAIRLAYIELGDEAVFLGSRRNDVGNDPNQAYEVTFALMEPGEPAVPSATATKTAPLANGTLPMAPKIATSQADEGAFLSWKKLLRHVSSRDPRKNGAAQTEESSQAGNGVNAALRNGNLRHWKDFVPGDLRESQNAVPQIPSHETRVNGNNGKAHHNGNGTIHAGAEKSERPPAAHRVQLFETNEIIETPPPAVSGTKPPATSLEKISAELEELRRMIAAQQSVRETPPPAPLPTPLSAETRPDPIYRSLIENAIDPEIASEIATQLLPAIRQGADKKRLAAQLAREIKNRFATDSELGSPGATAVVAMVGPSGAGKTTAVAKLAFRCGLLRRRRVRLLSVDQLRIGAVEPLQAYAELMNAPLEIIDDFDRFAKTLSAIKASEGELILIDTPGYGRREWERARRLAATFTECGDVDVHLVLDLRTRDADLRRVIEQYRVFSPSKLIFTRLDETTTFGTMLNETVRTGLPLSFVSVGQRVPEDIVPAGEPELLRLLLKDRSAS